jgi:two-component system sensor histidine kinase VanS
MDERRPGGTLVEIISAIGRLIQYALVLALAGGVTYLATTFLVEYLLQTEFAYSIADYGKRYSRNHDGLFRQAAIVFAAVIPLLAVLVVVWLIKRRRDRALRRPVRGSARLRLAMSYAVFLVAAGAVMLLGLYVVLRYIPDYSNVAIDPTDPNNLTFATRSDVLQAVIGASGIILGVLAMIGVGGGWILAGWVLRPLQRINDAADIAATGRLDHRIRLRGRNDEFRRLADSFDLMLGRLEDAFTTQERFAANASHELRTPLAVTKTMLDVARRDPDGQNYARLLERLSITNARAINLTEALLRLANANAVTATAEPLDLAAIAQHILDENEEEAVTAGVHFLPYLQPARMTGDSVLLGQLVTNLVQNAIRHGAHPGTVVVRTGNRERGTIAIQVENGGTQYTREEAARLIEPFLRGGGRVRKSGDTKLGYGLGLTLVDRITEVHQGALRIVPREGGGLVITATFAAAYDARRTNWPGVAPVGTPDTTTASPLTNTRSTPTGSSRASAQVERSAT